MPLIKNPQFEKSITTLSDRPSPELPEIAIVGRSNVGKSSLINALVNIRNFAKVSRTPGKTRTINYFRIDNSFYIVDLPGYGYAKVSRVEKKKWQAFVEPYLLQSNNLCLLFVLIDSKVGPKEMDILLLEWLRFHKIPFQVIATKADKISRSLRPKQEAFIRQALALRDTEPVIFFSAKDHTGKGDILKRIDAALKSKKSRK